MSQIIFYINYKKRKRNTAGSKAPDDILTICKKCGFQSFSMPVFPSEKNWIYKKIWLFFISNYYWFKLGKVLPKSSIIIYQHPSYGKRVILNNIKKLRKTKNCRFIALVHDLESLRGGISGVITNHVKTNELADNKLLKCFDVIICHNEHMRQYMIEQGFDDMRLINLEIFDYLSDCERKQFRKNKKSSIVIAGNLAIGKCGYIYKICEHRNNLNLEINLYGNNYEENKATDNIVYHGSFNPEELPEHLIGDFGLVWDGISVETCTGNTGEYLKYNNPHKTSLYLASGIPVIVWNKAAIADFIITNKVGIVIDNLYNLENEISKVTEEEYQIMCDNVKKIALKLKNGYYFQNALKKALDRII